MNWSWQKPSTNACTQAVKQTSNTLEEQVNNPSDIVPPSLTKAPCYNNNQLASLIHVPHVQCIPTQPYNHQSNCIVSKPTILEALHRSTEITTANCASLAHKLYFVITTSLTPTQYSCFAELYTAQRRAEDCPVLSQHKLQHNVLGTYLTIYHNHANHSDAETSIVEIQVAEHVFQNSDCLSTRHFAQCVNHLQHIQTSHSFACTNHRVQRASTVNQLPNEQ